MPISISLVVIFVVLRSSFLTATLTLVFPSIMFILRFSTVEISVAERFIELSFSIGIKYLQFSTNQYTSEENITPSSENPKYNP